MATNGTTSEFLYHVKRTIIDFAEDKSGSTCTTDILGTFTSLEKAKAAARGALTREGYVNDDFAVYEVNTNNGSWGHGDGVFVFAKAPAGHEFEVRLDTKPNVDSLKGNEQGEVEGVLHYVLQTTIFYNNDRVGGIQTTEVESTHTTRAAAYENAKKALLDDEVTKESFAEYDGKDDFKGEWPYGEDVFVHAVSETGENYNVAVKAQPHRHGNHPCAHHGGTMCACKCKHSEEGCKAKACKHNGCEAAK